jgi:predicted AlkP superfamily pyrophosphatase or phosphodiesterase
VKVVFLDCPAKHTTKSAAFEMDSWMSQNIPMDESWKIFFLKNFPKLAFRKANEFAIWEWVSYLSFIPLNLPQ